ncbi:tRNA1(Val) (adenine(37)-N6)-methyltransferase [Ligilactobacillus sp. LYQ139]|uniref:tRNA1(Val) (adenine(37)-N6)-methyltransferase n=1 Tax=Ligilactobacillus sp. LYQ139 TaxID=3378800 RepID=UPI0038534EFD
MQVRLQSDERIDQLYAHDIRIIQSPSVFSFSLDAVLLADFARPILKRTGQVVDLCAGNGAVGLFLSAKTRATITAVELQPRLADMARRSVLLNNLENRMRVLTLDLNDAFTRIPKDSVDTVTCNPPYFPVTPASKKNPNRYLAVARHELTVTLEQVIRITSGLLKTNGHAYLVHRPDRLGELIMLMREYRLAPKRVRLVYPKAGRDANIVLVEGIKDGRPGGMRFEPPVLTYGKDGQYTPAVREMLYGDAHQ